MGSVVTSKKGLLKLVNGQISVEVNGENQPVQDGEQIPQGAVLHIGDNATYEITFDDGTKLSNEELPTATATTQPTQTSVDEIQALQDLIAAGEDPTKNLPETAAGNPLGRDGNSGYVSLARDGSEALATAGYATTGQGLAAVSDSNIEHSVLNSLPSILLNDFLTILEGQVATGNVLTNDSDEDSILSVESFSINGTSHTAGSTVTLPGGTVVINADGSYTFTSNEHWNGQVPVVTYSTNTGSTATLTINVTPIAAPTPTLAVTQAGDVNEGSNAVFTVSLSNATEAPLTINLGISLGSAEANDIGAMTVTYVDSNGVTQTLAVDANGNVTIPAGVTNLTVSVATHQDTVYEGPETFSLVVTEANGITTNGATGVAGNATIIDDEIPPVVNSVVGNSAEEGLANTFTITLSNPSATATTVTLSLSDGSATIGTDTGTTYMVSFDGGTTYTLVNGNTVSVPANATSFLIQVAAVNDAIYESNENYTLTASANGGSASGDSIITDNDSAPKVASITGDTVSEGQSNTFTVNLTNTASTSTDITLTLASGSATKGLDFSGTTITVTINGATQTVNVADNGTFTVSVPANTGSFTVEVATTDDTIYEAKEDYTLSGVGTSGTITGTSYINDNDILGGDKVDLALQDADTAGTNQGTDEQELEFTASGAAAITQFSFGATTGITVTGLNGTITWTKDPDTGNLIGNIGVTPMIVLSLNGGNISKGDSGSVTVTATLLNNLQHQSSPVNVDSISISGIVVIATDELNHTASGTVNITVADDPVALTAGNMDANNAVGIYVGDGLLDTSGVDQDYTADLSANVNGWNGTTITFANSGITAGGLTVYYYVNPTHPNVLIAYTDTNHTPSAYGSTSSNQSLIFTLTTDPMTDKYTLDLNQSIDKLSPITIAGLQGGKGGISDAVYVTYDAATENYAVYNNIKDIPTGANLAFTLTARDENSTADKVNGTDNGFGVANPFVSGKEILLVDYSENVASASFNFTGASLIHFKAYNDKGTLLAEGNIGSGATISNLGSVAYFELSALSGTSFQFTGTAAQTIVSSSQDVDLAFKINATDSDGDTTSGDFNIHLAAANTVLVQPLALTAISTATLNEADLQNQTTDLSTQSISFKSGSNSISHFQFGDTNNISVTGIKAQIHWAFNEQGQLIGTVYGKDALRLSLDWDRINAGEQGSVIVTAELLAALPHNVNTNNLTVNGIQIIAVDGAGNTATSSLNVTVIDDVNVAINDDKNLSVLADSFKFSGVVADWISTTGGTNIKKYDSPDNDIGKDQIRWGSTNGNQSGYGFQDNDNNLQGLLALNQDIVLGTFTHYNYPISSGSSISAATMQVTFTVTDVRGITTPVTLTVNFSHNETPNSNNAQDSRDIVTVGQSNVTFNYQGQMYTMQVIGFKDSTGKLVTSIYTNENAATSYELVVRMVAGTGYTLPHSDGNVLSNDIRGADDQIAVIGVASGEHINTGVSGQLNANVNGSYGTLVLHVDGSYTYQLTANVSQIPTSGTIDTFTYTIQDGDSDTTSALLTIHINPVTSSGSNVNSVMLSVQSNDLSDSHISSQTETTILVDGQQLTQVNTIHNVTGDEDNQSLIAGLGDDILRGDGGADTFVWRYTDADSGVDHITDFNANEDKLDLSDLLQGETTDTLDDYLNISVDSTGSTLIDIDANKDGVFEQHITLDGVDLYSYYGATDNHGVISNLLGTNGDGPLITSNQPVTPEAVHPLSALNEQHNNGSIIP